MLINIIYLLIGVLIGMSAVITITVLIIDREEKGRK